MTGCSEAAAPTDGGRTGWPDCTDGGDFYCHDPWLDCGDGGLFYCTERGEPLQWGPEQPMGGCYLLNQANVLVADGGGGYCPEGYAFFCEEREVCSP